MKAEDYDQRDALGLANLIRRGEVSAAEVCKTAIACIEALNPALNAVVAKRFDQACWEGRKIARDPFQRRRSKKHSAISITTPSIRTFSKL